MEFTCEQIGLTPDELQERVVAGLVDRILRFDGHALERDEDYVHSTVMSEANARVIDAINAKVDEVAAATILPRVDEMIAGHCLQETNKWGDKVGKPLTFTEYLVHRAESYLTETVNHDGKTREQDNYNWKGSSTRVVHLIDKHLQYSISTAMQKALATANSKIIEGIEKAVKIKLSELEVTLKTTVGTKKGQ
jgi:hypothetical protein